MTMKATSNLIRFMSLSVFIAVGVTQTSRAHCDTMDGPVVQAAKAALEKRDVTPVLKWVQEHNEAAIRSAFASTLVVRRAGPEAKALAEQFFFETLVRLHRAGEGAPFTGLKPSPTRTDSAIDAADEALRTGSAEALIKQLTETATASLRQRFQETREKQARAEHNVAAGRAFISAYVAYLHYVEALDRLARQGAVHQATEVQNPSKGGSTQGHE